MKVCVIQPQYSVDWSRSDELFRREIELLHQCDESMDLIVMPEYSDVPCKASTLEEDRASISKYGEVLIKECRETAKRCNAIVFTNARQMTETGLRNTTLAIDRKGEIVGKYYKEHLVRNEEVMSKLDAEYTYEHTFPTVIEIEGLRFGFLVCYDFYFYENFANMARQNYDIIIGCSHQRSDRHSALEIMCRFLAYNTNAYVVRSSISMDESSDICGASMVVAPDGEVLVNMKSRVGLETVEIDPHWKYLKPAGFGNPPSAHHEYIEIGRRAWKYRPAGSAIVRYNAVMPYPRVCAYCGFNTIAPENSLAAFGAAIAMGAEEIGFDLQVTKDGELVTVHDEELSRVSDGEGKVCERTYEELLALDFGVKFGEKFRGLRVVRFEDILKKFSCHVIMNVHVKVLHDEYDVEAMKKIVELVRAYDCERYVYFMINNDSVLRQFKEYAPDLPVCVGHDASRPWGTVDRAIALGAEKVQLSKPYLNREMIERAHKNGIRCNVFYADTEDEAKEFLELGADTVLTNDYNLVAQAVKEYKKK